MRIEYTAPPAVREAISGLGRTEDIRFSPNQRRLAVAAFARARIAIIEVDIETTPRGVQVALTGVVELRSDGLQQPHGLDFVDDETLVVANRAGGITVLRLPAATPGVRQAAVTPIQAWPVTQPNLLGGPGSVAVLSAAGAACEILVCNNHLDTVTRHRLDLGIADAPLNGDVLLQRWLDIPDGVTVSRDRRWIAISNHNTHRVLVYECSPELTPISDPVAVLGGLRYPHGLRFSADSRHLFVADAGAPEVHVFAQAGEQWGGVYEPESTITVMPPEVFRRGHYNPQEGGPKGLDFADGPMVLVTTTHFQPIAFVDMTELLAAPTGGPGVPDAAAVSHELRLMELETRAERAEADVERMTNSTSWRITAPLRHAGAMWRRRR